MPLQHTLDYLMCAHITLPLNVFLLIINSRFLLKHRGDGWRLLERDTGGEGRYDAGPG